MAFTLHWPNTYGKRCAHTAYADQNIALNLNLDRVCAVAPSLSVQADVLYPNAKSGISVSEDEDHAEPPGCVGHQLDNSFPVESRTPVPLPLVMYPLQNGEVDTCALPVLNWEKYCIGLYASVRNKSRYFYPASVKPDQVADILRKRRAALCETLKKKRAIKDKESTEAQSTSLSSTKKKGALRRKLITYRDTRRFITEMEMEETEDIEQAEQEVTQQRTKEIKRKKKEKVLSKTELERVRKEKLKNLPLPIHKFPDLNKLPEKTVRKFLSVPGTRIQGTWNYLYNGAGACSWLNNTNSRRSKYLFVGNGTKLRMLSLIPSKSTQMLSYTLDDIWEEDQIPSNVNYSQEDPDDFLNSQIFQIKTITKRRQVGVRRGKSIEIYLLGAEGLPSLLASVPNVGYGGTRYAGLNPILKKTQHRKPNPLLTSFDLNRYFPSELVMIDENAVIQFVDIGVGRVTKQLRGVKKYYPDGGSGIGGPQNLLNDLNGVSYVGDNPQVIFYWAESSVHFHDARVSGPMIKSRALFNLRTAESTRSFSDQDFFWRNEPLSEYISSFVINPKDSNLYYIGTSQRVFLMDIRVPRNPVIKMGHGLASPPAYMDILSDDNWDVLVAGSQRSSETFCAFIDRGHLACTERVDCQRRNPILQSYPGHLSNSREFHDFVLEQNMNSFWESDFQATKAHCDAWTTGLCLMKPSKSPPNFALPSSFMLYHGNAFGDVFVQEWDQKPILSQRKVESTDERLKSFLCQWQRSMARSDNELPPMAKPTIYVDHTILMEEAVDRLNVSEIKRSLPFDPFTPHSLVYNRVRSGLPSVQDQIDELNPSIQDERGQKLLRHWGTIDMESEEGLGEIETVLDSLEPFQVPAEETESVQIKEEVVEEEYEDPNNFELFPMNF